MAILVVFSVGRTEESLLSAACGLKLATQFEVFFGDNAVLKPSTLSGGANACERSIGCPCFCFIGRQEMHCVLHQISRYDSQFFGQSRSLIARFPEGNCKADQFAAF